MIIDSLKFELQESKKDVSDKFVQKDTGYIDLLLKIGDQYRNSQPDSALLYYEKALSIAKAIPAFAFKAKCLSSIGVVNMVQGNYNQSILKNEQAIHIADSIGDKSKKGTALNNIGIVYASQGKYNEAVLYFEQAVEIFEELGNTKYVSYISGNIGIIYENQGKNDKAIFYYQKVLKVAEEEGDQSKMAISYHNIAGIHAAQQSYDLAIDYFKKAIKLHEETGDTRRISSSYNNIANVYKRIENYKKAKDYYEKSLVITKKNEDKRGEAMIYNNIGLIYKNEGFYSRAINYFKKASVLYEEMEDLGGKARVIGSMASLYNMMADTTGNKSYYKKAIFYADKALKIAIKIGELSKQQGLYNNLMHSYNKIGDYKKAFNYAELYNQIKDSLFNEEKTKAIQEMETRYQAEKKQFEIDKLEKYKELKIEIIARKEAENKKQRLLMISFIAGFVIIVIFSAFLYRLFLQKKRANVLINRQKEIVESQKKHITDSIVYAQRIQQAILPSQELIENVLGDHFILFKPKDIVSGDFYWVTKINEWKIVAVTDCTGHGVPGAFMSMLGLSFLNEIVRKKEIIQSNQVLNELRTLIIENMQQKGEFDEQQDGMDMAICAINSVTKVCHFAGANNSLYIIRQGNLLEIKGDDMPVAIFNKMDDFQNQEIQLEKNDRLYLSSDGYADQFGGERGRKFMKKHFKKVLLDNSDLPMKEQKTLLEKTLNEWMNHIDKRFHQIDDITVIGMKI